MFLCFIILSILKTLKTSCTDTADEMDTDNAFTLQQKNDDMILVAYRVKHL